MRNPALLMLAIGSFCSCMAPAKLELDPLVRIQTDCKARKDVYSDAELQQLHREVVTRYYIFIQPENYVERAIVENARRASSDPSFLASNPVARRAFISQNPERTKAQACVGASLYVLLDHSGVSMPGGFSGFLYTAAATGWMTQNVDVKEAYIRFSGGMLAPLDYYGRLTNRRAVAVESEHLFIESSARIAIYYYERHTFLVAKQCQDGYLELRKFDVQTPDGPTYQNRARFSRAGLRYVIFLQ